MKKKILITCEIEERRISPFLSMLKRMEFLGKIGASRKVSLYSDGDGDLRPKFEFDGELDYIENKGLEEKDNHFDAG